MYMYMDIYSQISVQVFGVFRPLSVLRTTLGTALGTAPQTVLEVLRCFTMSRPTFPAILLYLAI